MKDLIMNKHFRILTSLCITLFFFSLCVFAQTVITNENVVEMVKYCLLLASSAAHQRRLF